MRHAIATATAVAVASAGTLAMTGSVSAAAPAASSVSAQDGVKVLAKKKKKKKAPKYAMGGDAYGTMVTAGLLGLKSNKTAPSTVGCTMQPRTVTNSLIGANVLPDNEFLKLGVTSTATKTGRGSKAVKLGFPKGTRAASVSTSKIADVKLGGLPGLDLGLVITGLGTEARAWVDKNGKFKTKEHYKTLDIQAKTGIPLVDELLNGSNNPLGMLLDILLDGVVKGVVIDQVVNGVLKIANLGEIRLGKSFAKTTKTDAASNVMALQVRLFGADGKRSDDDIAVELGRARATVVEGFKEGRFGGYARALEAQLLDGTLQTARLAAQPMPCQGTDGKWIKESVAGVDLLNLGLIKIDAVSTEVMTKGKRKANRSATARARTARVVVGGENGLVIEAITSQATAQRNRVGKLSTKTFVDIGAIKVAGQSYSLGDLLNPVLSGLDSVLSTIGIASIKTHVKTKAKNGGGVIALQIKLLSGKGADVKIGEVQAKVSK